MCLFCDWKNDKDKIVLENELAFAVFDEFGISKRAFTFYD